MTIKPDTTDFEPYALLLESNKRIRLYDKKYFGRVKTLIYMIFACLAGVISAGYVYHLLNVTPLVILSAVTIVTFLVSLKYCQRLRSASIIGDSLILKNSKHKPYLTTLNTVKKARTYTILSVQCTLLDYHLDGKRHKTILIGNPPGISISLDTFFINAKQWSKNKNKRQTISRVL